MRAISATDALRVWEAGEALSPYERTLALLEAACPDEAPETLARLPLGGCNARILRARARTYGPVLPCVADCPACGEPLEFALSIEVLLGAGREAEAQIVVEGESGAFTFRLPTPHDVLEVAAEGGGARSLLCRCLLEGAPGGVQEAVVLEAERRMAEADPLALVRLDLGCPACAHAWEETLDVASFFFQEIAVGARQALNDVHRLARAYGWSEPEVLDLSPRRRRHYLSLLDP